MLEKVTMQRPYPTEVNLSRKAVIFLRNPRDRRFRVSQSTRFVLNVVSADQIQKSELLSEAKHAN